MSVTFTKALIAFLPVSVLCAGSAVLFFRGKSWWALLQLIGAACMMIVVLCHVCEALHLFPWMQWGSEHSIGHYLDFCGAVLGLTLFLIGYLLHALTKQAG